MYLERSGCSVTISLELWNSFIILGQENTPSQLSPVPLKMYLKRKKKRPIHFAQGSFQQVKLFKRFWLMNNHTSKALGIGTWDTFLIDSQLSDAKKLISKVLGLQTSWFRLQENYAHILPSAEKKSTHRGCFCSCIGGWRDSCILGPCIHRWSFRGKWRNSLITIYGKNPFIYCSW